MSIVPKVPDVPEKKSECQGVPVGNTSTTGKKVENAAYCWSFTWPWKEDDDLCQMCQVLKDICKTFVFQLEEAPSTGYKHYQGFISLKIKERMSTLKNLLGGTIHWEPAKNRFSLEKYAGKCETRLGGPWNESSVFIKTISKLRPFQIEAEHICLTEDDDRIIHWYWEPSGNTGKTQFCKYMYVKHKVTLIGNCDFKDMAHGIKNQPKVVLINIPKDTKEYTINYKAIECIKDGLIFSPKYDGGAKVWNSPVVIVFANFPPKLTGVSADKWRITNIAEKWRIKNDPGGSHPTLKGPLIPNLGECRDDDECTISIDLPDPDWN